MYKIALEKLVARSLVIGTISVYPVISADEAESSELNKLAAQGYLPPNTETLPLPRNRTDAARLRGDLNKRSEEGDEYAKCLLPTYNPGMEPQAEETIKRYNKYLCDAIKKKEDLSAHQNPQSIKEESDESVKEKKKLLEEREKHLNEINKEIERREKEIEEQAKSAQPNNFPSPLTDQERQSYEKRIANLLKQLQDTTLSSSDTGITDIYAELEVQLKESLEKSSPDYKIFKKLLHKLLERDSSDNSITKFLDTIKDFHSKLKEETLKTKIANIFEGINEDTSLDNYSRHMAQKEIEEFEKSSIFLGGEETINKLKEIKEENILVFLKEHPVLMLYYTDKQTALGKIWQTSTLSRYLELVKFSDDLNDLKAVYTLIRNSWKISYNTESNSVAQQLLFTIHERVLDKNLKASLKNWTNEDIETFIKSRLQNDRPIDYSKLEKSNVDLYQKNYDSLRDSIGIMKTENPLLSLTDYDRDSIQQMLEKDRTKYDKIIGYFKLSTLDQLTVILYHCSKVNLASKGSGDDRYMYHSLVNSISEKEKNVNKESISEISHADKIIIEQVLKTSQASLASSGPEDNDFGQHKKALEDFFQK